MSQLLHDYWWGFMWFAIGGGFNGLMDYFNFKVPHDTGFWSLNTKGQRLDAWHVSKILMLGCFAIGIIGQIDIWMYPILFIILGVIYSIVHGAVYHRIF